MVNQYTFIYYLHKGDNIPFYIGKTINSNNSRLNNHRIKYSKICYLEVIDIIPTEEWIFWEKYYISLFKSFGFNLENKNNGGGGCITHSVSLESRQKISDFHKGYKKPFSEEHKINLKKSLQGKKMPSDFGDKISKKLKGRKVTWKQGNVGKPPTSINQYDLEMNLIKRWDNIKEPTLIYKCYISGCLRGRQKSSGGYIWKYADK